MWWLLRAGDFFADVACVLCDVECFLNIQGYRLNIVICARACSYQFYKICSSWRLSIGYSILFYIRIINVCYVLLFLTMFFQNWISFDIIGSNGNPNRRNTSRTRLRATTANGSCTQKGVIYEKSVISHNFNQKQLIPPFHYLMHNLAQKNLTYKADRKPIEHEKNCPESPPSAVELILTWLGLIERERRAARKSRSRLKLGQGARD